MGASRDASAGGHAGLRPIHAYPSRIRRRGRPHALTPSQALYLVETVSRVRPPEQPRRYRRPPAPPPVVAPAARSGLLPRLRAWWRGR